MSYTPEEVAGKMRQLGLPHVFEQIWKSQGPRRFCRQWDRPVRFFDIWANLVERCPRIGECIPILESNRERIVAFDVEQNEFIEFYYNDSDCHLIGRSYQQFLSWIFIELGYAGLMDLVKEVANEFEYKYLDSLEQFMKTEDDALAEDAKRTFVNSVVS